MNELLGEHDINEGAFNEEDADESVRCHHLTRKWGDMPFCPLVSSDRQGTASVLSDCPSGTTHRICDHIW